MKSLSRMNTVTLGLGLLAWVCAACGEVAGSDDGCNQVIEIGAHCGDTADCCVEGGICQFLPQHGEDVCRIEELEPCDPSEPWLCESGTMCQLSPDEGWICSDAGLECLTPLDCPPELPHCRDNVCIVGEC